MWVRSWLLVQYASAIAGVAASGGALASYSLPCTSPALLPPAPARGLAEPWAPAPSWLQNGDATPPGFPRQDQPAHFSPLISFIVPFSTTSLALSEPHFFAGNWDLGGGKDDFLQDADPLDHLASESHSRGKKKQRRTRTHTHRNPRALPKEEKCACCVCILCVVLSVHECVCVYVALSNTLTSLTHM